MMLRQALIEQRNGMPLPLQRAAADEIAKLDTSVATLRGLLLWALYHHQGPGSAVGQPIRHALGIDRFSALSDDQIATAKAAAVKHGHSPAADAQAANDGTAP